MPSERGDPSTSADPPAPGASGPAVDLYRAGADGECPWVVYLHGGGWTAGSRKDHRERFEALAALGVSVASADYRFVTEAPYPAQREDIEAVLDLLPSGASRVSLMGASAGALLGALTAFQRSERVAGFIGLFGRYDLSRAGAELQPAEGLAPPAEVLEAWGAAEGEVMSFERRIAMLAGVEPSQLDDATLRTISPLAQLTADAPPMLLLHGSGDAVVDYRHTERLAERARRLGIPCRVMLIPGANHEGPEFSSPEVMGAIADFIHTNTQR